MRQYTIKHGSIAAIQYVQTPDGRTVTIVGETNEPQPDFDALPLPVRAAVNRQFGAVFSLPYDQRESFVRASLPFTVDA